MPKHQDRPIYRNTADILSTQFVDSQILIIILLIMIYVIVFHSFFLNSSITVYDLMPFSCFILLFHLFVAVAVGLLAHSLLGLPLGLAGTACLLGFHAYFLIISLIFCLFGVLVLMLGMRE